MYESIGKMVEYSCVLSEQRRKSHVENPTNNFNILGPQNPLILVFGEHKIRRSNEIWSFEIGECLVDSDMPDRSFCQSLLRICRSNKGNVPFEAKSSAYIAFLKHEITQRAPHSWKKIKLPSFFSKGRSGPFTRHIESKGAVDFSHTVYVLGRGKMRTWKRYRRT